MLPSKLTADSVEPLSESFSASYPFPSVPTDLQAASHPAESLPPPPDHASGAVFPSAVLPTAPELPTDEELATLAPDSHPPRSPLPPINVTPAAPMLRSKSQFSPLPVTPSVAPAGRQAAAQSFAQTQYQAQPGVVEAYDPQTVGQAQKAAKFAISACVLLPASLSRRSTCRDPRLAFRNAQHGPRSN